MPVPGRAAFNEQCLHYWQRLLASRPWRVAALPACRPARQNHLRIALPYEHLWLLVYRVMPRQQLSELGALVKFDREPGVALWERLRAEPPVGMPEGALFTLGQDRARESRNLVIKMKVDAASPPDELPQFEWFAERAQALRQYMSIVQGER